MENAESYVASSRTAIVQASCPIAGPDEPPAGTPDGFALAIFQTTVGKLPAPLNYRGIVPAGPRQINPPTSHPRPLLAPCRKSSLALDRVHSRRGPASTVLAGESRKPGTMWENRSARGNSVQTSSPKAVVLLSGGIDSATCAAIARARGFAVSALTVDYGQRHRVEIEAARRLAQHLGLESHHVVSVDLRAIGRSALLGTEEVPKDRAEAEIGQGVPPTYVPARNTILLALALALAESIGAADIFIGANVLDYSGYPDCRPEFLRAFERLAKLATKAGTEGELRFRIHAPLLFLTKAEIIRLATSLGVDLALTVSCYDPPSPAKACGRCDSCQIRKRAFLQAGIPDPTVYEVG